MAVAQTLDPKSATAHDWLRLSFLFVASLGLMFGAGGFNTTRAQGVTGSIKVTVSAAGADPSAAQTLLAGARLTLVNRDLNSAPVKAVTNDSGSFAFIDLPVGNYALTAEADGLHSVTHELQLTTGATLIVEILLYASVSESVTVRADEGLASTGETTTTNIVRSETLTELPLRTESYQSALPFTPGVVRTVDGVDHVKGTSAAQSAYTVNGVDVTDPVTGRLAFDIPVEAAATVQIEENAYSAEFGRFTGGVTNLETKTGGDKFSMKVARFFPTFSRIIAGKIDSFRPRLTFSGPVIRKRVYFVQSFEYRFSRTRFASLKEPNESTLEGFNIFTQLDATLNKSNRVKFVAAFYPQKIRNLGLDTFNPQQTTPNTKQRGNFFSVSEQSIFHDESFLSSLVSFKKLGFDVFAQGSQPLTLIPDGNTGNYFADTRRSSRRFQWQETYYAHPFTLSGKHSVKLGGEFDHTTAQGTFKDSSIFIRRQNLTLSQRLDFSGPEIVSRSIDEFGLFVQDRWVLNRKLTVDAGLRLDHDSIASSTNVAPRLAFLFLPLRNERTVVRGGVGIFFDRIPVSLDYFSVGRGSITHYPERTVTTYATDGVTILDGPRRFTNVSDRLRDPRSVRWSLQLDRDLAPGLTLRIGYIGRSTTNQAIINPLNTGPGTGQLRLASNGRAKYQELQVLALYSHGHFRNWNLSYVWSRARGDLNAADEFIADRPAFVVRPNQYGPLSFDTTHRFLAFGEIKAKYEITILPSIEIHSGFPFSFVNDRLDFVGLRNQGHLPLFFSVDSSFLKGFKIPFLNKRARAGVVVFNMTRHFNPRDVQNNNGSSHFGEFFNSQNVGVRGKFEVDW